MKNLSLFFIAFLLVLSPVIKAQWVQQYSGNPSILFTTNFVDNNNGFAAGANETFLVTTNGGLEWTVLHQGGSDDIYYDMFFKDSQTGWTVLGGWTPSRQGYILKTTNGGISRITQFYIDGLLFISVFFIDDQKGWAVATNGIIFNTTNGGSTWNFQYQLNTDEWLYDVYFIDQNNGWAVGNLGNKILKTTDGGNSWQWKPIGTSDWLLDIEFIDQNTGITVGDNGRILRSKDGGDSWDIVQSGTSSRLRDVECNSSGEAWVVGFEGVILHSTNDGNTWIADPSGTVSDLYSVSFINGSGGWVCGDDQLILHRDGTSSDPITVVSPNGGEIITAGSTYFIEWNSQNVIDVKIEYSTDNGVNWISIIDSIPSTGIYDWTVPSTFTTEGRVKISDLTDPNIFDISDQSFTIQSSKVITVISPNGGEILDGGSEYEIQWSSEDVEFVKLEYSINNGASWDSITDSTESTGVYLWTVPNILTTQARTKISDISLPSIYDASDEPFRINYVVSVDENIMVTDYKLYQNYPNPFNPSTIISWQLPDSKFVILKVYDVLGNEVASLINEEKPAGNFEVEFSATGGSASGGNAWNLSSGIYYYKLVAGDFVDVKKMLLLK